MDCFLVDGSGVGFAGVSGAVLRRKVAPARVDEPLRCVYGNDQLWALPVAQDPVRYRRCAARRSVCHCGGAVSSGRQLWRGRYILESARAAIPEVETALRIEASGCNVWSLTDFCARVGRAPAIASGPDYPSGNAARNPQRPRLTLT